MEYVILLLATLIQTYAILCFFFKMNNKKFDLRKHNILLLFTLVALTTINNLHNIILLKNTIQFIILFLTCYLFLDKKVVRNLIIIVLFYGIIICSDLVLSFIIIIFKNNNIDLITNYYYLLSLFASLFIACILYIIQCNLFSLKLNRVFDKISTLIQNKWILLLEIVIYILISCVVYTISLSMVSYIYLIMLLIICSILIFVFQFIWIRLEKNKLIKDRLLIFNQKYSEVIENDRVFKHNIKNKLLTIKSIGDSKVKKLVDAIIVSEDVEYYKCDQFVNVPESFLTLFYDKLYNKDNFNIVIRNNLKSNVLNTVSLKKYSQLNEVIGICLDNAIEAMELCQEPALKIEFIETNECFNVIIKNNFTGELNLDMLGDKNYSTKKRESGLGLYSIKKSTKIDVEFMVIDEWFKTKIIVSK